jgi:hypothetical protein
MLDISTKCWAVSTIPNPFKVEIAIAKLKRYKSPGSDQITTELVHAGVEILQAELHKLINSIWNKETYGSSLFCVPVHKKGDKTDCTNYRGISLLSNSCKMLSNILLTRLSPYIDEIFGIISVGFDITDQLLIRSFAFVRYWRKKWVYERVHQLFVEFKRAQDSVRKEVL